MFMDGSFSTRFRCGVAAVLSLSLVCAPAAVSCPFCLTPPDTWAETAEQAHVVLLAELVKVELNQAQTQATSHLRIVRVLREHGSAPSVSLPLGGLRMPRPADSAKIPGNLVKQLICEHSGIQGTPGRRTPGELHPGQIMTLDEFVTGNPGDIFMLSGTHRPISAKKPITFADESDSATSDVTVVSATQPTIDASSEEQFQGTPAWTSPVFYFWEVSSCLDELTARYLLNLPSNSVPAAQRLPYYIEWLECSNPEIAADAWGEFARSDYSDVLAVRHLLDREKLRTWIADPTMSPERLGLYGMMLGLCGQPEDAEFMQSQIGSPKASRDFRFGSDGIMGGYLLLAGEDGLRFLEESRLKAKDVGSEERFAAMQAIQFVGNYESDVISKQRLIQSLHHLLDHPEVREYAIRSLARWQDWEIAPQLASFYYSSEESDSSTRESVLSFMIAMNRASGSQSIRPELLAESEKLISHANESAPRLLKAAYYELGPPRAVVPAASNQ